MSRQPRLHVRTRLARVVAGSPRGRRREAGPAALATAAAAVLASLAVVLGVVALPAQAADQAAAASPRAAQTRTPPDLPGVPRVAATFPYLEGGRRYTFDSRTFEVARRGCWAAARGVRVEKARFASYAMPRGGSPYDVGLDSPTFVLYRFADRAAARTAFGLLRGYVERCEGTRRRDGLTRTVTPLRVVNGEVVVRTVTVQEGDDIESHWLELYRRDGRYVERSWIQAPSEDPARRKVERMARVFSDVARS